MLGITNHIHRTFYKDKKINHRRIRDNETFVREVSRLNETRNLGQATVDWQFTTADVRIKLKKLYSVLQQARQNQ